MATVQLAQPSALQVATTILKGHPAHTVVETPVNLATPHVNPALDTLHVSHLAHTMIHLALDTLHVSHLVHIMTHPALDTPHVTRHAPIINLHDPDTPHAKIALKVHIVTPLGPAKNRHHNLPLSLSPTQLNFIPITLL